MSTPDTPPVVSADVLVVGAGPTGLYAAFRGLSVAVVDSLPEPSGQVTAMYPEKQIFDVAGFPSVRGRELVERLLEQAAPFGPRYLLGHRADVLERGLGTFAVTTHLGTRIEARAVIVTGGIGTFTPRPLVPAAAFEGNGLAYFVRHLDDYAGGGDSAFDWALALHPVAKSVKLVHRRETFRAHPATVAAVREPGVELVVNAEVSRVLGGPEVAGVELKGGEGARTLRCGRIIAALGFTANLGPLLRWGFDVENRRHIPVDAAMTTSVPGIFAAGDIIDYPGKVRLIAVGFGGAATAVNNAAHHLDPAAPVSPGHSTDEPARI
ncbi:NAD(P)/FAD-dependent oxidoreductase [Amycolatopsis sp. NPDC051372]|uniref:NAD(P)/FAD-dependent oxidoreductase n=1 Tax=Amycolatopsis sp. NPDC051372 TaxID=3155669 RepID=UPI00341ED5FB